MPTPIVMPKLGYDVETGTVLAWTRNVGDRINEGDVVAEVEAAKGNAEVESPASGTLIEIVCKVGEEVLVGDVLGYVDAT